jgi:putative effector of murein hydrolase LrgA (UPF0299 family)
MLMLMDDESEDDAGIGTCFSSTAYRVLLPSALFVSIKQVNLPETMMTVYFKISLILVTANAFAPTSHVAHFHNGVSTKNPVHPPWSSIQGIDCSTCRPNHHIKLFSSSSESSKSESTAKKSPTITKSFLSASILVVLDIFFRRLLQRAAISFPSSLAGCGALFTTLLLVPFGESMFKALSPGAALLAKWLPVFFVPSLVTLPLADGLGSASEVRKIIGTFRLVTMFEVSVGFPSF